MHFCTGHYEEQFCENILNLDQWFRCCFKTFLIYSYGGIFAQWSGTIYAILVEDIISNNPVHYFEFVLVVQEMFNDISYLEPWRLICSVNLNHLCNFGRGYPEEQFCEFILNMDL